MMDLDDRNVCQQCSTQSEDMTECRACQVRLCSGCNEEHKEHQ